MIEQTLFTLLSTSEPVTAIANTRIYPLVIPEDGPLPALTYAIISGTTTPTLTGRGTMRWRVEINCYGNTYSDAVTLRKAVIDTLDGYYLNTSISIRLISPQDFFDHELLQYRAMAEFYIYTAI